MHVLNVKMSKVINTFIMQIHKFFFLFFFLFLFCLIETIYWTKYAVFLPLNFCLRGKPRKPRIFWWLVNTLANISGHIHGCFFTVLVLLINYYSLVRDFFPLDVTPHFLQMSRFIKYESTNFGVFRRNGGLCPPTLKVGGLKPPLPPLYLRPWE